ncbi:hypothetical protein NUK42_16825 [Aeromonas veronii]|uniref:hypothetical protein n=1 Tax=Aeromonas veronii TaxID=654 RepID=UPI00214F4B27|nr:hypothetical protein [Aeromonas veronii]MCR3960407.1 hypothetical protein [Aeromonas veronii]
MSEDSKKNGISIIMLLSWVGIAGATSASAAWTVGRAFMADELEQYKSANHLKIQDAIIKLTTLSDSLNKKLDKINDYENLIKEKQEMQSIINQLRTEKNTIQDNNKKLLQQKEKEINTYKRTLQEKDEIISQTNNRILSLVGATIDIPVGQALPVGNKKIKVGVTSTTTIYNWASVVCGSYNNPTMKVGDAFEKDIDDKTYTITLTKINNTSAEFSYETSKKRNTL